MATIHQEIQEQQKTIESTEENNGRPRDRWMEILLFITHTAGFQIGTNTSSPVIDGWVEFRSDGVGRRGERNRQQRSRRKGSRLYPSNVSSYLLLAHPNRTSALLVASHVDQLPLAGCNTELLRREGNQRMQIDPDVPEVTDESLSTVD